MSVTAAQRIREALKSTGSYTQSGYSSADWETAACGAGIDLADGEMESLLKDLFPSAAGDARLGSWEMLFFGQKETGPEDDRRRMVAGQLAQNPGRLTRADFSAMIEGAGIVGQVEEQSDGRLSVLVGRRLGLTEEGAKKALESILPAHLEWDWVEEMNWAALDAWPAPFETLDARGLTFEALDSMTRDQLEAMNQEGQ